MVRFLTEGNAWVDVQSGRFAYLVEAAGGVGRVKMILGNYLAAQVELGRSHMTTPLSHPDAPMDRKW